MLCEKITLPVVGEKQQPGVKQIFKMKPHFTYDKNFSGGSIMSYLGKSLFSDVMTCRHDCQPSNVPPQYFHRVKTDSKQLAKEDRFLLPVMAVKEQYDTPCEGWKRG